MPKTVALMTGGGDAPGLNPAIRAVVKRAVSDLGWRVIGIEDSFDGLLREPWRIHEMDRDEVRGILTRGGTILGTTNRGDPFAYDDGTGNRRDLAPKLAESFRQLGVDGLIAIGGDGTMRICWKLMQEQGVPVVGVPKTIDNDVPGTEISFGFDSAMSYASEAIDRLHSTAEAHDRVMVLELMGRDAGFIALHAGVAGGADVILIPEIPFDFQSVVAKIMRRKALSRQFSIVVVAEGARPVGGSAIFTETPSGKLNLGGIGRFVAEELARLTNLETRFTVLGHLQRGGSPTPYDRVLATRFGSMAVELVEAGKWGRMVAIQRGRMTSVALDEVAAGSSRTVDVKGDLVRAARGIGTTFGDEPS